MDLNNKVQKLTLASLLTALSIVVDVVFNTFIPANDFGFPYYAIPLVIGSIILGPIYGAMMGYVSDTLGFFLGGNPNSFNALFALSAIAWGVIPYFFTRRKQDVFSIVIAVLFSHLAATLLNTFALYTMYPKYATSMLPLRLVVLPINVILMVFIVRVVYGRIKPLVEVKRT